MDCSYGTRPLWFWNDLPTEESIKEIMENCSQRDGYAGFGILQQPLNTEVIVDGCYALTRADPKTGIKESAQNVSHLRGLFRRSDRSIRI